MRLLFFVCLLLCGVAVRLPAQRLEIQTFADIVEARKIIVHSNSIWLKAEALFLQLDMQGNVRNNFTLTAGGISSKDRLVESNSGEPFVYSEEQKTLLRWEESTGRWLPFYRLSPDAQLLNNKRQIWVLDTDSLRLLKNSAWQSFPMPPIELCEWAHRKTFLEQTKTGKIYFVPVWVMRGGIMN